MKARTRKATMTNKERVEALLRREKPDRVPFAAGGGGFAANYNGVPPADRYTKPEVMYEAEKKTCRDFDWVFTPSFTTSRSYRAAFGSKMKIPTSQYSQGQFVTKYAVETEEEVMALKVPDPKIIAGLTAEEMALYQRSCREKDENQPFKISFYGLGVMNIAGTIAGADKLCKWMIKRPEVAHRLLRLAADYEIATAQYFKDTFGVERVLPTGANAYASNQLISPKHFEQFALPYLKEVHEKILAMGFKHLRTHPCGEQNLNLPYWQQVPMGDPGIFHVGNEIDLETAAAYFPNDIIGGNLDTTVIQSGTPEEVYQEAKKVIEQGKHLPTGFILIPACELPPMAPVANIRAITRALNDFGWYD
ncbi:MAG: hypothetical protein HY528_01020 [Chloroflexi bacterium]|nr:hypothetical protein [Chloroflexota bacterium]